MPTPEIDEYSSSGSAAPAYAITSVFTAEATWSRPIRNAAVYSCARVSDGFAARSSHTALVCVTVTSSSTPSAPITTPASSSPRVSIAVSEQPDQRRRVLVEPGQLRERRPQRAEHADQREAHHRAEHRRRRPRGQPVRQVQDDEHDQARADDRDQAAGSPRR